MASKEIRSMSTANSKRFAPLFNPTTVVIVAGALILTDLPRAQVTASA